MLCNIFRYTCAADYILNYNHSSCVMTSQHLILIYDLSAKDVYEIVKDSLKHK